MPAKGRIKEPTRRILQFTRLAHQEYLSQRRVLEASWGMISDEEWLGMEFEFLNPAGTAGTAGHPALPEAQ